MKNPNQKNQIQSKRTGVRVNNTSPGNFHFIDSHSSPNNPKTLSPYVSTSSAPQSAFTPKPIKKSFELPDVTGFTEHPTPSLKKNTNKTSTYIPVSEHPPQVQRSSVPLNNTPRSSPIGFSPNKRPTLSKKQNTGWVYPQQNRPIKQKQAPAQTPPTKHPPFTKVSSPPYLTKADLARGHAHASAVKAVPPSMQNTVPLRSMPPLHSSKTLPSRISSYDKINRPSVSRNRPIQNTAAINRKPHGTLPNRRPMNPASHSVAGHQTAARRKITAQNRKLPLHKQHRLKKLAFRIKEKHPFNVKKILTSLVLFLLSYILVFGFSVMILYLQLQAHTPKNTSPIFYEIVNTDETQKLSYSQKREIVFPKNQLYINMTHIASVFKLTTTGDAEKIRFISNNADNDYVIFEVNNSIAYINGIDVNIDFPVLSIDNCIYVPYNFFTTYMLGITVEYIAEENAVYISRTIEDADPTIYQEIEFLIKSPSKTHGISEDSLPIDILIQTDPTVTK